MKVLLCEGVNDLRHSLFHLLNCLIVVVHCLCSVVFQVFQCKKTSFLYYCPDFVGKTLTCLTTSTFLPDLYHSFSTTSLGRVAPKISA